MKQDGDEGFSLHGRLEGWGYWKRLARLAVPEANALLRVVEKGHLLFASQATLEEAVVEEDEPVFRQKDLVGTATLMKLAAFDCLLLPDLLAGRDLPGT